MEKPYRIEHEKDIADTRYRWQYRAGIKQFSLRSEHKKSRVCLNRSSSGSGRPCLFIFEQLL